MQPTPFAPALSRRRSRLMRSGLIASSLMAPAFLCAQPQARAFTYGTELPGVTNVVADSNDYDLTDSSPGAFTVDTAAEIEAAVNNAQNGDVIIIKGGIYNVGDLNVTKDVTIRAAQNAQVWLDGAKTVSTAWVDVNGGTNGPVWSTSSAGYTFNERSPKSFHTTDKDGFSRNPQADDPEMVFFNNKPQVQVGTQAAVNEAGEFFEGNGKIYLYSLSNPGSNVQATNRDFAFALKVGGSTLRGLNFRRYAGQAPIADRSPGSAVRIQASATIDKCSFFWNGGAGIDNDVSNTVISRSNFVSNGWNGIVSGGNNSRVFGNTISFNNAETFRHEYSAAGIKIVGASDNSIYDNFFEGNKADAIWVDVESNRNQMFRNYIKGGKVRDDSGEGDQGQPANGFKIEICRDNVIAWNLITGCGAGVNVPTSSGTRIHNNTLYENKQALITNDADRSNSSGGDDSSLLRVTDTELVNNIFLAGGNPQVGAVKGSFPTVPSKSRFSAMNFNVYRDNSTQLLEWKPTGGAAQFYNTLSSFRAADATENFEANGVEKTPAIFENVGSLDFRVQGTETDVARNGGALPADIRGLLRDNIDFVPEALTDPRCDLADVANGSFGAAPSSPSQKYRGAFKPTNAAPSANLTSPANNSRVIGAPATLNLTATAADDDGVSRVEFYNGATLLGTDNTPADGWSFTVASAARGTYSLTARAFDSDGASGNSAVVSHRIYELTRAVNAGGGAVGNFSADAGFSASTIFAASPSPAVDVTTAANPAPLAVYQSERFGTGDFTYTATGLAASSPYTVRLHFAETFSGISAAGQRLFNISVTGAAAVNNYDIYAQAGGRDKAVVREFTATSNAAGTIVVSFLKNSTSQNPKINGIETLR